MNGLERLIDQASSQPKRKPKPGEVWCVGPHAIVYRASSDGTPLITMGPSTGLCRETTTGPAVLKKPACPTCRAELARAAPVLAQRLAWEGARSTCGRYRISKQRKPQYQEYPFVVLERDLSKSRPGRWDQADSAWFESAKTARESAQELEFERLCRLLRAEARGEPPPGSPAAAEREAVGWLRRAVGEAGYACGQLLAARKERGLPPLELAALGALLAQAKKLVPAFRWRPPRLQGRADQPPSGDSVSSRPRRPRG